MNSYNIEERGCVYYHAIAENEQEVLRLVEEAGYDITGMSIELERTNVRDELGRAYKPCISSAIVR